MLVELRGIHKTYPRGARQVQALRGIDFTLDKNEYLAIMGPSGSGKTTLMNILGCLDSPTFGAYRLAGVDVADLDANELAEVRNKHIGFVFQTFNLLPRATALHNVEVPLIYSGVRSRARRELAEHALERVGLEDRMGHRPAELSGGEQQRVAIARALVNKPSMLLADEPTGNLDSRTGAEVMALFDSIYEGGGTVILVTHEEDVARHARRAIQLLDGMVIADQGNADFVG